MNDKPIVLAVDDSPNSLMLLGDILTIEGYQAQSADSGESALACVAASPPDLILLDIHMKGIDGLEVCRRLKAGEDTRQIPIILISGLAEASVRVEGLQLGAVDYITKPYQPEELLARVKTHLALRRANLSLEQQAAELRSTNEQLKSEIINRRAAEEELSLSLERAENSRKELISTLEARKRAEEEKAKLEDQLIQAQKMESVGRLAGGVAHDFNNMLGVILGYTEIALSKLEPNHPLCEDLNEIRKAAERSADITSQLLAFARKQLVIPKVLDLNETVAGMLNMLGRVIGEDIHLNWKPTAGLWKVRVDPSQIDQILANLCINARHAIANIGKITIEAQNRTLCADYCSTHTGVKPGEYVLLSVSDDGRGMEKETLSHIFEPFFTTRAVGEGTGLGLSSVYGAVTQNNGFIDVSSEPGHGTIFNIYLPRHIENPCKALTEESLEAPLLGQETILFVEDEPAILKMTTKMLERLGYSVLPTASADEALRLAKEHSGKIHLLITDVIMPKMSGRDLAKNLLSLYPNLKRLFISGYAADVIANRGVLEEGVYFIQKPFSIIDLSAKVREVLDGELRQVI